MSKHNFLRECHDLTTQILARQRPGGRRRCKLRSFPSGHPARPRDPGQQRHTQHPGCRARGDPDAGKSRIRPLLRHACRGARLRRPLSHPAARGPQCVAAAYGERQSDAAFPPGWQPRQCPARQRHPARLARQPAGLGQRPHGPVAALQERDLDGLLQGERDPVRLRAGECLYLVRRLPLRHAYGYRRQPFLLPHRHQRRGPDRHGLRHQRMGCDRRHASRREHGLYLDHLRRTAGSGRRQLDQLPEHARRMGRQHARRLPPVQARQPRLGLPGVQRRRAEPALHQYRPCPTTPTTRPPTTPATRSTRASPTPCPAPSPSNTWTPSGAISAKASCRRCHG
jgi:hypothetical protein